MLNIVDGPIKDEIKLNCNLDKGFWCPKKYTILS
jgi:hypothetical protein